MRRGSTAGQTWRVGVVLAAVTSLIAADATPKKTEKPKSPENKVATLEDFYGDTGKRFQAALSFYNTEPISSTISPSVNGYGIGVDDMFISWKETRLDEDTTVCAGECADLEVKSTLEYAPSGLIEITVTDKSPYDPVNPKNDCNGNGTYLDAVDDQDCNDNGTTDVVVKVTSLSEVAGEIAVLDRIAPGSPVYRGRIPFTVLYDSPGSIFVQASGTQNPEVTASYEDRDDGTGARCANALSPEQAGFLLVRTTIAVAAGRIDYRSVAIALSPGSPGDDDGFADAGETLDLAVRLRNKSGLDLDDLVVGLASTDPKVECISVPLVSAGAVLSNADFTPPPFRVKIASAPTVQRTSVEEELRAHFTLTVRSNKFDSLTRVTEFFIDLDLNVVGGTPPTSPFLEDFEGVSLGKFTLMTLDAGKNTLALSDGYRCQYNDPFGPNTNSPPPATDCFLGFTGDPAQGVNDWHIQKFNAANCNSGRAYTGVQSLRWGTCALGATTPVRDTARFKQLDAVATIDPINLPPVTIAPAELTFKHQVSFVDNRNIPSAYGETTDRGVVQVQLANAAGDPIGSWTKITAYVNAYEQQGTDNYTNCTFDPVDDGNDEDDFFDPADPLRRLGPSSTCFPEFVYSRSGHTDWRLDFNPGNVGLADGPGLQGNPAAGFRNPGTWVEPKFDLSAFAGQRIRVRFLATSIELGLSQLWDELFAVDNVVGDDGWFIDDVRVMEALSAPMQLGVDNASFAGLACPACSSATAVLSASPVPPLTGPGQLVTLQASASTLNACNGGTEQYQFWLDGNLNGIVGDAGDTLLRDWTDNSIFVDAPQVTKRYGVRVRCSTATACQGGAVLNVGVNCPSTGNAKAAFGQTIHVDKGSLLLPEPDTAVTVSWAATTTADLIRGNLSALRASGGNYTGTVAACLANDVTGTGVADGTNPGTAGATYFLVRPTVAPFCNQTPGYTTNHPREAAGRDVEIGADGNACP
ncbi:MAG TPA: hypothetical protein VJ826_06405 [Candidatus Polarisedimenticolaceae bacterium]|nr:hypothetical protein [Candidatus Polarisedimenticolaceae bacterium]